MSDSIKKLLSIMNETTSSGSVAPVIGGGGKSMLKRSADSIFAAEDGVQSTDGGPEKSPAVDSPSNFGLWKNSVVIGKEQYGKHGRKKTKVDKTTMYPQLGESYTPPKDMDEYTDDDWAEWDAKVKRVGAKAKEQDTKKAKEQDTKKPVKEGVAEGLMNKIANKVMGAAPEQPKYKVGQRVKYETSPHQPDWKDGGRGVGVITDYKNGHYMINGNPVNHFEIKGVVDQGVAEGQELSEEMIADRLKSELALFKKGAKAKDKDLGDKSEDREVQPKKSKSDDSNISFKNKK